MRRFWAASAGDYNSSVQCMPVHSAALANDIKYSSVTAIPRLVSMLTRLRKLASIATRSPTAFISAYRMQETTT